MTENDSSEDFKENVAIVIDSGSGCIKAGYSGDERPRAVLRSSVGVTRHEETKTSGEDQAEYLFGSGIPSKDSADVIIKKPITNGVVTDWESLEKLWHHILYKDLQACPKEHGVLVTDSPLSSVSSRAKIAELLFEQFETPALYISHKPVLCAYSYGLVSGLVVDSGSGSTFVSPVCNGYCLPHATFQMDLAGRAVTSCLQKLMTGAGFGSVAQHKFIVREIKKQTCYVSPDFERELKSDKHGQLLDYQLPDGSTVTLGDERFRCPEILFCPSIAGVSQPGIHITAMNSLQMTAPEWHATLMANVVMSGGTTLLNGFPERLQAEMEKLAPRDSKIRVLSGDHREFASWLGGSILPCLSSFQPMWVKRQDYFENGSCIVQKKCY
ncbi:actin-3-like [Chanos chanos]|uniref:Actin-3-like n=1 Tax=Chanos chanos TaxID=29144 RepID=A0A6J2VSQ9_CHACN|nr:actin-3-like [Chanos chanos]